MRVFTEGKPEITERYEQPDAQGTVAHGFIVWHGHKFAYRQVRWDVDTAREANIKANLGAGEWDWDALSSWDTEELAEWMDGDLVKEWNTGAMALGEMLKSEEETPPEAPEAELDKADELQEKWQVQPGDLYGFVPFTRCPECGEVHFFDEV